MLKIDLPKLLVSIRSAEEANIVENAEIGILDVKEPSRGGLGASDPETLREIAEVVNRSNQNRVLSFSAGELIQWFPQLGGVADELDLKSDRSLVQHYGHGLLSQYKYVKVGLAGSFYGQANGQVIEGSKRGSKQILDWRTIWKRFFEDLPIPTRAVAVVYLDFRDCSAPPPGEVIRVAAEANNCDVVLFDTFHKSGNLFSHVSITELEEMVRSARNHGLIAVIAGSIDLSCLVKVVSAAPDFVGVRGAVCRGERTSQIDSDLVDKFARELVEVVSN